MICTRLLGYHVMAYRQAIISTSRNRFRLRVSQNIAIPSLVFNRNMNDTVKKRALEARSKLKKPENPLSRYCASPKKEITCTPIGGDPCKKRKGCKTSQNINSLNCKDVGSRCKKPPPPPPPKDEKGSKKWMIAAAVAAAAGLGVLTLVLLGGKKEEKPKETKVPVSKHWVKVPANSKDLPKKVPYLLVGGGTASFSAFRAIKSNDPQAKVLVISNELLKPYMRPPLSKELWYVSEPGVVSQDYRFKQWTGAERSLFFEPDEFFVDPTKLMETPNGGIAVAQGYEVKKVDPKKRIVTLTDGTEIEYGKCLLATGCTPKSLPVFTNAPKNIQEKIMFYRSPEDFEKLKRLVDENKSITVVGSGFLGSELCCSLASYAKNSPIKINQIYPELGNMSRVLPEYLSKWTTNKVEQLGVCVVPGVQVKDICRERSGLKLTLSNGQIILTDVTVVCIGCEANTDLATLSGLEVDPDLGGFVVNAELEARQNLFVAGDASCFYDPLLGRRRLEHHDHSVISGRLAGENMASVTKKPYEHQSMFWSDLGPSIGYEGIGRTDASLPTVGVFAISSPVIRGSGNLEPNVVKTVKVDNTTVIQSKDEKASTCPVESEYGKGVIFYLKDDKIVGILLWNIFNRIGLARTIVNQNKSYKDLNEVAKLFEIHS